MRIYEQPPNCTSSSTSFTTTSQSVESLPTFLRRHYLLSLYLLFCHVLLLFLLSSVWWFNHSSTVLLTSDDFPVLWHCPPSLPSAPFLASRVLVLTTDNRSLSNAAVSFDVSLLSTTSSLPSSYRYYVLSHYINTRYAQHHGYAFRRIIDRMENSTRDVVWSKVYHLLHSVDWSLYDYVVAVDSDAWFTNVSFPLHDMLNCFAPDMLLSSSPSHSSSSSPSFLFSLDYAVVAERRQDLNAGVFIMRTTTIARRILELWWDLAELPTYMQLQQQWPAEQGVLNELLMHNTSIFPHTHIRSLPRQIMYGHAAAYINHVTSYWPRQKGWEGRREMLMMRDIAMGDIQMMQISDISHPRSSSLT
jgi:hypothetical protein